MKKRIISVQNWDKWQARGDKELPWFKCWGRLFRDPWFQLLSEAERFATIAILDLARQFNNKIDAEILFKGYFFRVYGLHSLGNKGVIRLCNSLCSNGFLSDNCPTKVRLEGDKTRQDKTREERSRTESVRHTSDEEFLKELKSNPAYKHINFDQELGKMDAWLKTHNNRKKTRRFIVNWLNKVEAPVTISSVRKVAVPNKDCTACSGTGKLIDGVKCWCFR